MIALQCFQEARQLGCPKATRRTTLQKYRIGKIYFQDKNYPEAIKWLTKTYEEDLDGDCNLNKIYLKLLISHKETGNFLEAFKYVDLLRGW